MCNKDSKCKDCSHSGKIKKSRSKRRASPYIIWITAQQKQRREELKNLSQPQKIKKLAAEWRAKKN